MSEFETLFVLAQIAVALAGFSAIVVTFKRRESGKWVHADADFFNGMVLHSVWALLFCIFPSFVNVFTANSSLVWSVAGALLGIQVLSHATVISFLPSTTRFVGVFTVAGALFVVVLQALNIIGIAFEGEFGPYLVGVLWHLAHASLLFTWLIFIRRADVEDEP